MGGSTRSERHGRQLKVWGVTVFIRIVLQVEHETVQEQAWDAIR